MNSIILYAAAIMLKIKPSIIRILISGTIGSLYAMIIYVTQFKIYESIITKIILSVIMVYIAFNPQNIKKLCKCNYFFIHLHKITKILYL